MFAINNNDTFDEVSKHIYQMLKVQQVFGMKNSEWFVLVSFKNAGYSGCSTPLKHFSVRFGELLVKILCYSCPMTEVTSIFFSISQFNHQHFQSLEMCD